MTKTQPTTRRSVPSSPNGNADNVPPAKSAGFGGVGDVAMIVNDRVIIPIDMTIATTLQMAPAKTQPIPT